MRPHQVPDVLDLLEAEVAPPIGRSRAVSLVEVRPLREGGAVQHSQRRIVDPPEAPVQVVAIERVVGMYARWRAEHHAKPVQRSRRSLARAGFHGRAMERDLEAAGVQVDHEVAVVHVVHGLREEEVPASLLAAHRPDGLRGPHAQRFQQPVDRPDIVDRRDVGVVDNREREARAAGERMILGHPVAPG